MRQLSIWTTTFAVAAGLSTGAWAQHGGGVHSDSASAPHPASSSAHGTATTGFENRLADNTKLSSRLEALLPPGTSLQSAATGFKREGQFIAALHVSHNLNIPFSELKAQLSADHESLGKAIHALRPEIPSKTVRRDVKVAEHQTKTDLEESGEATETASSK